ncbi:S8 family peptidase [Natroniella sp. ANB-PHB2]|uniref:S8 family peptidase n=1 Tax=Natroniella sp. ANB-PHB2 TaxID=3384444 RepID=UPI0038D37491
MKKLIVIILMMLTITGCSNTSSHDGNLGYLTIVNTEVDEQNFDLSFNTSSLEFETDESEGYLTPELLVKFKKEEMKEEILKEYGLKLKNELTGIGVSLLTGVEAEESQDLVKELNQRKGVEFAELNRQVKRLEIANHPDDKQYEKQWHYSAISLPQAWQETTGSEEVTVAVIDSGIDKGHIDLEEQKIKLLDEEKYEDKGLPSSLVDEDEGGHGTHVTGTIGALASNQDGEVVGTNWNVTLFPIRVFGEDLNSSGSYGLVAGAIELAVDNGADIINLSLGGNFPSKALKEAIDYAYQNDVTVIAAGGNEGNPDLFYPAQFETVISVGAVDHNLELTLFSNYGKSLDFVAPGQNIYSTIPDNQYGYSHGTSMAAPHVAGVAALLLAEEPDLTPDQIKERLKTTAQDLGAEDVGRGWDFKYGYGLINAHAAVTNAQIGQAVVFAGKEDGNQIKLKSQLAEVSDDGFYHLEGVEEGEWHLYAWIDLTDSYSDSKIEQGDYFGKTAYPVGAGLNVDFQLELLTENVEWEIKKQ